MPKYFLSYCFILIFSVFVIGQAQAETQELAEEWVEREHFKARLAPVPDGYNKSALLEIDLADGWHTYGQDPGDAGLPPRFNWEGSINLKEIKVNWPEPIQKREFDMFDVNAYEESVSFPLDITPVTRADDVALKLKLDVMVCNEICIPDEVELSLRLKPADAEEWSTHTP